MENDILEVYSSEAHHSQIKVDARKEATLKNTQKEVEKEGIKTNSYEEEKFKNLRVENLKMKTEISDLRTQNKELSTLNMELQRTVIGKSLVFFFRNT